MAKYVIVEQRQFHVNYHLPSAFAHSLSQETVSLALLLADDEAVAWLDIQVMWKLAVQLREQQVTRMVLCICSIPIITLANSYI